jgi:hypothetical protein
LPAWEGPPHAEIFDGASHGSPPSSPAISPPRRRSTPATPTRRSGYHVHSGNWEQVDRALFRLPEWPVDPEEQYVRWFLWSKERAVVSHETALAVYELSDVNPAKVHLTVPPRFRKRAPGIVLHMAELPDEDIHHRRGYRITAPIRTVLDVAAAGQLELDQVAKAIADGERRGWLTHRMLVRRADALGDSVALRIERALRWLVCGDANRRRPLPR